MIRVNGSNVSPRMRQFFGTTVDCRGLNLARIMSDVSRGVTLSEAIAIDSKRRPSEDQVILQFPRIASQEG